VTRTPRITSHRRGGVSIARIAAIKSSQSPASIHRLIAISEKDIRMPSTNASEGLSVDADRLREEWLKRLDDLINTVDAWAKEEDWVTRRITKKIHDSTIGTYHAPALIFQKETARMILEPIARSAPGTEGVVDLYLMPAYDDVASLFHYDGGWQLHYVFAGSPPVARNQEEEAKPLSRETLHAVLQKMIANAA